MTKKSLIALSGSIVLLLAGCGSLSSSSPSTSPVISSETPDLALGLIQEGLAAIGSSLSTTTRSLSTKGDVSVMLDPSECDSHGYPTGVSNSDGRYPGVASYCQLKVNSGSPDTVQGGFEVTKAIACAVRKAGALYDGNPQTLTLTADASCFTPSMLQDMPPTFSAVVTGSSPASFNNHYERGLEIDVTGMGMIFKMGTTVNNSVIEYITYEDGGTNKTGMTAGSLNRATGEIRYEARFDRIDCSENGSCGWNRHIRLYADMSLLPNGDPGELESISLAISNLYGDMVSGQLVTASGNLTDGIKARYFFANNGTPGQPATNVSHFNSVGNWEEVVNTKCYTATSENGVGCDAGLDKFSSSTKFALTGTELSPLQIFNGLSSSMTFTSVNLDSDVP